MKNLVDPGSPAWVSQQSLEDSPGDDLDEANFETAFGSSAERTAYLKKLITEDGVSRIQQVATLAALKALTPTDKDLCLLSAGVDETDHKCSLYQFFGSSTATDNTSNDEFWVVEPDAGIGRWLLVGSPELFTLDSGGTSQIKAKFIKNSLKSIFANASGTTNESVTSTSAVQITHGAVGFSATSGDKLEFSATIEGRMHTGAAGYGVIQAKLYTGGGAFVADLGYEAHVSLISGSNPLQQVNCHGIYTFASTGIFLLRVYAFVSNSGDTFRVTNQAGDIFAKVYQGF